MTPRDLLWLVTVAAIVGTVANVHRRRWGFGVWACTNAIWAIRNAWLGEWPEAALWTVYVGLALWGLATWRKHD